VSDVLRVNPIACDGHGLCAEIVPELIELELYLMSRARGMAIETPAVRP